MRRRYDSDVIHRADRRETDRWKKVKLAGIDGGDDPSSVHNDFQGEETGDRSRDADNVPKTSEYAFFKKLKEERHQKSHLHPPHADDDHAERLWLTNRRRGNGDSSAAVLLEDVIPAQLPTACLPAICTSGNPDVSSVPFGFVHDQEVLAKSADFSETLYKPGEIFSRTRKNLLSRITTSSLPEIGELCSKGSELASVLLSRLTPKDRDTSLLLGLEKSQLVPRVDGEVSYQNPTWEYVDTGGGNYLMDSAFSSGKSPTAVTVASKRITCQGKADCMTGNLNAVFPDAGYDFSSNFAMIEDGYKPFHGWNYEDASWSSGGAERKGDLSMPFDDWVLEAVESRRFPSDATGDLMKSPRLPSGTFGHLPLFRNSTSDEEENAFDLSFQSAASPGPYPASLCASCSQDPDNMARLPLLTDGIPSRSSPLSNYPFMAKDCSFYDWIPNESSHRKHRQPCPRPAVESLVISSGFDLRLLSPAGLAGRSGTLTRFPYQLPLPSLLDSGSETLDNGPVGVAADPTCHFYESQFCVHLERSSLYLLSISDRGDPLPGLPSILD